MAVGALADQMEKAFINYMEAFLPILTQGLSNNAEYQVQLFPLPLNLLLLLSSSGLI